MRKTRSTTRRWLSLLPSFLTFHFCGKSCVCPAVLGLFSLLNQENKGKGAKTGFVQDVEEGQIFTTSVPQDLFFFFFWSGTGADEAEDHFDKHQGSIHQHISLLHFMVVWFISAWTWWLGGLVLNRQKRKEAKLKNVCLWFEMSAQSGKLKPIVESSEAV